MSLGETPCCLAPLAHWYIVIRIFGTGATGLVGLAVMTNLIISNMKSSIEIHFYIHGIADRCRR